MTYLVLAGIVTLLFFTSQGGNSPSSSAWSSRDFYSKTVNAMDKGHAAGAGSGGSNAPPAQKNIANHDVDADGDIDEDDDMLSKQISDRLRQAEQKAKDIAQAKGPNKPETPEEVVGVGSSASGQKKPILKDGIEVEETQEDHEVEDELNAILKKSPSMDRHLHALSVSANARSVIIFSKSYCPYSKAAKGILLEKYTIEPAPFVVELDHHPLGPRMQAKLGEMTGRRTVPNVMVSGQSIGGGDDIAALDRERALADKITSIGGARIRVSLRFEQNAQKAG